MSDTGDSPGVLLKVVLCGDSNVGKTCLIERMFSDKYDANLPPTIGVDCHFKRMKIDNSHVGVSVWDTAGQECYRSIPSIYFRNAHGAVFVYDVTRPETLDNLVRWMDDFKQYCTHPNAVRMVVGNKIDLESARAVSAEQGAAFARAHGCLYRETSAKTDCGGVEQDSVYNALVWGMVVTMLDTPGLAGRASRHDNGQQIDVGSRHGDHQAAGRRASCC